MNDVLVLIPEALIDALIASDAAWGQLGLRTDTVEHVRVVTGYSAGDGVRNNTYATDLLQHHYIRHVDEHGGWQGMWYRTNGADRGLWAHLGARRAATDTGYLAGVVQGWVQPPADRLMPILVIDVDDDGPPNVEMWEATGDVLQPARFSIVSDEPDRTRDLEPGWPVGDLADVTVTIVGVGSIGSAASEALASYGIRNLTLVDHDRLLPHNLVRHRANRRWLGCKKVNATRDTLLEQHPHLNITSKPVSVINAADEMRGVFADSDLVLCCADGIEARWACSHLGWWARTPMVFACVLDGGAYGEVMRIRPAAGIGCLRCQRLRMAASGQIDPEGDLDAPYETGSRHRPMTAVPGDLGLVADLAVKVAVATLLERHGHADQRLPGDHAVVALRAVPDRAEPFDLIRSGLVGWHDVGPPVDGCPTCEGE